MSETANTESKVSRRTVIEGIAAAAVATIASPFVGSRSAHAQGKEITMSMSGGSFMTSWQTEIIDPFTAKTGIKVKMTPGNLKTQATALLTSSENARPFDLFIGQSDDFVRLVEKKIMMPLDSRLVPSINDIDPKFKDVWGGFGSMFDYFSMGLTYDTKGLPKPPASWKEFVDGTASGKFGKNVFFPALSTAVGGPEVLMGLTRALSGSVDDKADAGFEAVKRMKANIFKFFGSPSDPFVFLNSGEGLIGPATDGRAYVAQDDSGGKIAFYVPSEGAASNGPPIGVVKGGNTEAAYQLIDFALSAEVQKAFCEKMNYGSVNSKVVYSDKLASRIPKVKDIFVPDPFKFVTNIASWTDRWNREILT